MDLKYEIYKRGYTLSSFCEKAKINRITLYKHFAGYTRQMQGYTINQIAKTLDIPYEKVYEGIYGGKK